MATALSAECRKAGEGVVQGIIVNGIRRIVPDTEGDAPVDEQPVLVTYAPCIGWSWTSKYR